MRAFIGITDRDWFNLLSRQSSLDEVNFWQPSGNHQFRALTPGELFLFKLHSPDDFIVGGGFFAHSSLLPISLAWDSFGIANGATDLIDMRSRVAKYRRQQEDRHADYTIGCILLEQPFFLTRDYWIPVPSDWKPNIVQGRGYDLTIEPGLSLWNKLGLAMSTTGVSNEAQSRYGEPIITMPRLGQGSFRVLITDIYERRCAMTGEKTLPALEAGHIRPYSNLGQHSVSNGMLLRRDLHALFDKGYVTVTPSYTIEVSKCIKEEFANGRDYYRLHGTPMHLPLKPIDRPAPEHLEWHNENVFKG